MKSFSTVLLSIMGSILFAGDTLFDQFLIQDQQEAHLVQANLYLANPYVALSPIRTATLPDEDGIAIRSMRGVECFAQPDHVTIQK